MVFGLGQFCRLIFVVVALIPKFAVDLRNFGASSNSSRKYDNGLGITCFSDSVAVVVNAPWFMFVHAVAVFFHLIKPPILSQSRSQLWLALPLAINAGCSSSANTQRLIKVTRSEKH